MKKLNILIIAILFISIKVNSQTRIESNENKFFIGLNSSYSISQIYLKKIKLDYNATKVNSYNYGFELGYYFSKNVGIGTGFGLSSYISQYSIDSLSQSIIQTDSENDEYEMSIYSKDFTELTAINYYDIPISLMFKFGNTVGFFLNPGVKVSLFKDINISGKGTFTYEGYYSQYNITLHDLPEYGFPTNKNIESTSTLQLETNISLLASSGIFVNIGKHVNISVGGFYDTSIQNISKNYDKDFILSGKDGEINSVMVGAKDVKTQAYGGIFSLKYLF